LGVGGEGLIKYFARCRNISEGRNSRLPTTQNGK